MLEQLVVFWLIPENRILVQVGIPCVLVLLAFSVSIISQ